jgi:5-methyltetrahydrofolate--homocysteine methyltransferase
MPGPVELVTSVSELVPLVDWAAFLRDWEVKGHYAELQKDAQAILEEAAHRGFLGVRCAYGIFPAARQGDDILIYRDESRRDVRAVLHCLRRQQNTGQSEPPLSLADFLYDAASGIPDWIGAFAVNAGHDLARAKRVLGAEGDDYRSLLLDTLANRLAEAASELLFRNVRDSSWGFGSTGAGGIRPAPGYPTCPDHRDKALIFSLLDAEARLGLALTESCMMVPVAAVCGWYFASPAARYFSVGKIAKDQLEDYARRRGESPHTTARWLSGHLSEEARG